MKTVTVPIMLSLTFRTKQDNESEIVSQATKSLIGQRLITDAYECYVEDNQTGIEHDFIKFSKWLDHELNTHRARMNEIMANKESHEIASNLAWRDLHTSVIVLERIKSALNRRM